MKLLLTFVMFGGLTILFPQAAFAAVIITEVHPNPLSGPEWVELYNTGGEPVDLTNWWLEEQLASVTTIHVFSNTTLVPQTYLKVELATQKLNNTADGVTLKDASGTMIDTMSYTTTTPGLSWSRSLESPTFISTTPTPGAPHAQPTPTPTITNPSPNPSSSPPPSSPTNPAAIMYLQPSEIMACPDTGQQEWLELYNPTDYTLELTGWHVRDNAENVRIVSGIVLPHTFGSLYWASGLLNNTGDSLTLISPENDELFTAHFGPCQKNTSYILDQETWKLTTFVTPNAPNKLGSPTPTPSIPSTLLKTSPAPKTMLSASDDSMISNSQKLETPDTSPPLNVGLTSRSATTSALHLSTPVHHPFIETGDPLDLSQPLPSLPALVSVIIGGTVLLATHGLRLYRLYQHAQIPVPPPRVLFP